MGPKGGDAGKMRTSIRAVEILLCLIVTVVVVHLLTTRKWSPYVRARYQETDALVVTAIPKETGGHFGRWGQPVRHFECDMTIQYVVDGKTYCQKIVYPGRFVTHRNVKILYRKDDPSKCVLQE